MQLRKTFFFLILGVCSLLLIACHSNPTDTEETTTTSFISSPATTSQSTTTVPPETTTPETTSAPTDPQTDPEPVRAFVNETGEEIPDGMIGVLKAMFFTLGEAENRFTHFDYTPYFVGGMENESCRYYTAQSTYYANFRREEFDPVLNLRQKIAVLAYAEKADSASVTISHSLRFSYAHMETDSSGSANYELVLKPAEGGWMIDTMRCTNNWFETSYRGKIEELERMAAEVNSPQN